MAAGRAKFDRARPVAALEFVHFLRRCSRSGGPAGGVQPLLVSEPAWKGWRSYLDGRRVELQIANRSFLAVYVPRGRHEVRLVYLPQSFVVGRGVTMAALAAIVLGSLLRKVRQLFLERRDRPGAELL